VFKGPDNNSDEVELPNYFLECELTVMLYSTSPL
jgi:hypothetical protein